eukprot:scaffold3722_cov263-Pinguiococcus_pyrenoidosus.AAC.1
MVSSGTARRAEAAWRPNAKSAGNWIEADLNLNGSPHILLSTKRGSALHAKDVLKLFPSYGLPNWAIGWANSKRVNLRSAEKLLKRTNGSYVPNPSSHSRLPPEGSGILGFWDSGIASVSSRHARRDFVSGR